MDHGLTIGLGGGIGGLVFPCPASDGMLGTISRTQHGSNASCHLVVSGFKG